MAADAKRSGKTEVLSMRMDPKTRFLLDVLTRLRGQSISTVVERVILEAADNASFGPGGEFNWRRLWHVSEGVRYLNMISYKDLYPSYEDEYKLDFTRTHWPFFYTTRECKVCKDFLVGILWPRLDEFVELWTRTKSSDYFAAGKAMQKAILDANVQPPDWPPQTPAPPKSQTLPPASPQLQKAPSWDAPQGSGDLDDEIPF